MSVQVISNLKRMGPGENEYVQFVPESYEGEQRQQDCSVNLMMKSIIQRVVGQEFSNHFAKGNIFEIYFKDQSEDSVSDDEEDLE